MPAVTEPQDATSDQPQVPLSSSGSHNVIKLTSDVITQKMQGAKVLITWVVFLKDTMMYSHKQKKCIIEKVIKDSVPQSYGPNGMFSHAFIFIVIFQSFITSTVDLFITSLYANF